MSHNKLQTLTFCNKDLPATEEMYFRGSNYDVIQYLSKSLIDIPARSFAESDTFFNGFSVGKWKKNCTINDLNLALTGAGRVLVRVGIHVLHHAQRWLHEEEIFLKSEPQSIEIKDFESLTDGMIYFRVTALEDAKFTGGYYYTNSQPLRDVNLGIVITHFNRKHYILPAIDRVSEELLQDKDFEEKISLIVVDNSQNITSEEAKSATVIPNKNLGGAGGFTRGLLHLKDNNFTHCMFMDDDASCEIESIRRTYKILQYARFDNVAVSGVMMREAAPFQIHEAGAIFDNGTFRPLKGGLDMRQLNDLLMCEEDREPIVYGGWWHFAFKISAVNRLAFPFFVRGDDALFSILNDFKIITMNGIGEWAEDFHIKESPFTRYLGMRAILVMTLVHSDDSRKKLVSIYRKHVKQMLYSYNYSSARALTLAMQDVLSGTDFWEDNIDMIDVRSRLAEQCPGEKIHDVIIPEGASDRHKRESKIRYIFRKLSKNGFLLPDCLIKNRAMIDNKHFIGDLAKIFRQRRVVYIVPGTKTGYEAEFDRKRFKEESRLAKKTAKTFLKNFESIKSQYVSAMPYLTSEEFWRKIYKS